MRTDIVSAAIIVFFGLLGARRADAIPYFAHEYALTCQKCHSVIPRLNDFGSAFMDRGYALPNTRPQHVFPFATKINVAYSGEPDASGLPKALVDEVEIFLAGQASPRTNYFVEQYLIDGGRPGATRELWFADRLTADAARVPVYVQGGSFTLPLPVDPEAFRETAQHYSIFDQVVGDNPFNFFEPKIGVQARVGFAARGLSIRFAALQGHDAQSGVPSLGTDTMTFLQEALGPVSLSYYRYDGSRPDHGFSNRFWRQGVGVTFAAKRWTSESVVQTGHDTSYDGAGTGAPSSGGFSQLRYEFDRRLFGLVRYEGTNDPANGFTRDIVQLLGYRVTRNARLTIENVTRHEPQTKNTLNVQYTVAY